MQTDKPIDLTSHPPVPPHPHPCFSPSPPPSSTTSSTAAQPSSLSDSYALHETDSNVYSAIKTQPIKGKRVGCQTPARGSELQGEFINRFDADCSLKAQIPEPEDWSWASSPEEPSQKPWWFIGLCCKPLGECVLGCVQSGCIGKKETAAFLYPLSSPLTFVISVIAWLNVRMKYHCTSVEEKMLTTNHKLYFLWCCFWLMKKAVTFIRWWQAVAFF